LNLLKDTIVRLESPYKITNLLYFNCSYTKEKDYLIFGKFFNKFDGPPIAGNIELLMKIDKSGEIIKKKFYINNIYTGTHSNLIEDSINNRYVLFGSHQYFLDYNFEIFDSMYITQSPNKVDFNSHTTQKLFPPNKFLLTAQINYYHRGLAILDKELKLIKSVDLTTKNDPGTIEVPLALRSMDFKDTSSIYVVFQGSKIDYYTVSKVNSNLNPYWIKYCSVDDTIGNYLWSMKATIDGGCIIAGNKGELTNYSHIPHNQGSWMKKFDSDGNSVGIQENHEKSWEITVFPNPSQGEFIIEIDGNAQKTNLQLFDMQGRKVKDFNNLALGKNHLNMYNLFQGMYIWKLEKNGKIIGDGKWFKK
jgi:hypothetical protein